MPRRTQKILSYEAQRKQLETAGSRCQTPVPGPGPNNNNNNLNSEASSSTSTSRLGILSRAYLPVSKHGETRMRTTSPESMASGQVTVPGAKTTSIRKDSGSRNNSANLECFLPAVSKSTTTTSRSFFHGSKHEIPPKGSRKIALEAVLKVGKESGKMEHPTDLLWVIRKACHGMFLFLLRIREKRNNYLERFLF